MIEVRGGAGRRVGRASAGARADEEIAAMARTASRSRRLRRLVLPLAAAAGAVGVARHLARRRPLIEPVVEDLRHPILYVPLSLRSERVVRFVNSLPAPPG